MSEIQLPEGWVWKRLSEVSDILMGQSPASESYNDCGEGLPFFQGKAEFTGFHPVVRKWCTDPTRVAESGDILLSVRAPVGPTNIADQQCCIGRGLAAIRGKYVNQQYLYWYFKGIQRKLEGQGTGSTFGAISKKEVWEIPIPLPPLPVQQAIVARIEELFSELEAGVKELRTALVRLKTYRQAVLHHYLNSPDWERVKLGDLIISGPQNGLYKSQTFYGSGNRIVRIDNFYDGLLNPEESFRRVLVDPDELTLYNLTAGDILINRVNSMTHIGKCALVKGLTEETVFESNIMRFALNTQVANTQFIVHFLTSPLGLKELRKNAKQAVNQASINQQDVKGVEMNLPNLFTQTQIVSEIETRLSEADTMETTIRQELVRAKNLRQSILKQAFEGKLVAGYIEQAEPKELARVSEPASPVYGSQGDQLTLF